MYMIPRVSFLPALPLCKTSVINFRLPEFAEQSEFIVASQ